MGTLQAILVLLIIWWVLRLLLRKGRNSVASGPRWTQAEPRPKGEIRIERVKEKPDHGKRPDDSVTDADFEELK